jgi:hypothetical protein
MRGDESPDEAPFSYSARSNLRVLKSAPSGSLPSTRPSHPEAGQGFE